MSNQFSTPGCAPRWAKVVGAGAVRAAVSGLGSSFAVSLLFSSPLLPARLSLPSRASAPALGSAAPGAMNYAAIVRRAACVC